MRVALLLCFCASAVTGEDEPGDEALAWMRFENAPEQYSGKPYEGKLVFDIPRHRHDLGFKQDWPRMNTLPEWFTVEPDDTRYTVHNVTDNTSQTVTGAELQKGLSVKVASDKPLRLKVTLEK